MQKHESAFTLIELMIAIAVAAVVLTLGVPSFSNVMERNQLSASINNVVASLNFARSEAVKRNRRVSVCHSNDLNSCSGLNYGDGWIIFVDDDEDGIRDDPQDEILIVNESLDTTLSLGTNFSGVGENFSFRSNGRTNKQGRFVLCKAGNLNKSKAVFITFSGRVRLAPHDSTGIPLDNDNNPITACL